MLELEHDTPYRSAGISMDHDLIEALDDLVVLMTDGEVAPSRSEIARNLLWSAIALVRSKDPKAAELLKAITDTEAAKEG